MATQNSTNLRSSYNNPTFKPFQSGCSMCYPSTDYSNTNTSSMQYGGNKKSLISNLPGKNLYKDTDFLVQPDKLVKDNYSISFNTSGGTKKKTAKKNIKGGADGKHMMQSEESHMNGGKKTLSNKKAKKNIKGGADGEHMMQSEESHMTGGKKTSSNKKVKKNIKGGADSEHMMQSEESHMTGGKKTAKKNIKGGEKISIMNGGKKNKILKKMKGGEESWGATGMPAQFYNPKVPLASYPFNSGLNAKSMHGPIDPKDVGVGMLAPFNTSKSQNGNTNWVTKIGGKKNSKKQHGKGLIPYMSDDIVKNVQKGVDNGIDKVEVFFDKLKKDYVNSVQKAASVKIGNQRLVKGGSKKNSKKIIKNKKGGDGSDFISTLNSRGPSNAPDQYWGVNGEKWFRQFNKTANYIPNSKLAKAATPKLLEGPTNEAVVGFNAYSDIFAPIKGGKSKSKNALKKKK